MLAPIIGEHPTLRHVRLQIPVLAATSETLVIVGEHGTGKSLLASRIHSQSPFASNKLITLDCRLLGDRDQLDLLFGNVPPANHSPLESDTTVVIKNPDTGCVGFREQLLHALNKREVWNHRARSYRPITARMIMIFTLRTDRNQLPPGLDPRLTDLLTQYETLALPSLAKRKHDIPRLAKYFIKQEAAKKSGIVFRNVDEKLNPSPALRNLLVRHPWKGNVTELKAFVRRLIVQTPEELLNSTDHQAVEEARMMIEERKAFDLNATVNRTESALIDQALAHNENKQLPTSYLLGISRRSVHRARQNWSIHRQ